MARYIFDIETNGFVDQLDRVHSLVLKDVDSGEVMSCTDDGDPAVYHDVHGTLRHLMLADQIIGHNIIGFDIPAIQKVYPWFVIDESKVVDTLVISRLIWTNLSDTDFSRIKRGKEFPSKLVGSHSLAAWGHRLGCHKGDYQGGWEQWSVEMQEYCEQDVEVTERLWKLIETKNYAPAALELEHQVQHIIHAQEQHGVRFDLQSATSLYSELADLRSRLEVELQDTFPPWWSAGETKTPKKTINYKDPLKADRTAGAPYTQVKLNLFNPGSRAHISDRLMKVRNWKPKEFTEKGQVKVDETVLSKLKYPEAQALSEFFLIQKRIGMLGEGKNAWIKLEKNGRIHGRLITNGAVTGRATHRDPNLAQVPASSHDKEGNLVWGREGGWGSDCRSLFTVDEGMALLGADASGLELRMLAHYMAKFDNGKYAKEVVDGDVHTANQHAAGLATRNEAKRFIYAFLYGAGPIKLAEVSGRKTRAQGLAVKNQFLSKTPALKKLIDGVKSAAERRGYLVGLDGRRLHVRSPHSALNTLLQSAGAVVCKYWLVAIRKNLEAAGIPYKQVLWVHDEVQIECHPTVATQVGEICRASIIEVGQQLNLRCPLDGDFKVGTNWSETH